MGICWIIKQLSCSILRNIPWFSQLGLRPRRLSIRRYSARFRRIIVKQCSISEMSLPSFFSQSVVRYITFNMEVRSFLHYFKRLSGRASLWKRGWRQLGNGPFNFKTKHLYSGGVADSTTRLVYRGPLQFTIYYYLQHKEIPQSYFKAILPFKEEITMYM